MTEQEINARLTPIKLTLATAQQIIAFVKEKLNESKSISTKEDQAQ
ncbi:DNA binding protein [Acinetobacter phage vB_AbaP_AS12]|uniref:DNA binding protein n=1 Tax=Acinetobacter phage vB_AbaP_AS12 TaxID=1932885 RepID=A0A218KRE2_9CAUD|nr:DNA binding protein [Acinetobacter phage vB_AbaP_AS12]APW79835.1 DNA binding protein [Acinetobacter phage vB_AbaP_AS12]